MNKSEWNLYSQVYDVYYQDYRLDIRYLDRRWQPKWTSVLEIGCGSGRLLPFFQRKGVSHYFGFDTCPEMLSISLKRIKSEDYFLCLGDFVHAGLQKNFDLVVYSFNTINYLLTPNQVIRHLNRCSANLKPDGLVFIDALVPFAMSKREDGVRYVRRKTTQSKRYTYELWDRRIFDPALQIEERHMKSLRICDAEIDSELLFKTWRRYYSVEEIDACAQKVGLKVEMAEPYYDSGQLDGHFIWLSRF